MFRVWERSAATVAASVLATGATVLMAPAASASPAPTPEATANVDCAVLNADGTCQVSGVVYAIAEVGDTTYIGGDFKSVSGVPRSNVAAIGPDGNLDPTWNPSTDGVVYAIAASSDGSKIFLGGGFSTVGGQPRGRLAAVTPDTGALVAGWTTTPGGNLVRALAVDSQDRLYVGGSFLRIGRQAIPRLAAVSQSTGAVDTAFTPQPSGQIRALSLSESGDKVYAAGSFTTIDGAARPGAAELTADTGDATGFAPAEGGVAIAIDATPSGRLFFATTSNRTYAYDVAGDNAAEYRLRTGGDVQAILATATEVYIGGHFNTLPEAKLERVALASFNPADGVVTAWNPGTNGRLGVWALTLTDQGGRDTLAIGGDFGRVAGLPRRGFTRFAF